MAVQTRSLAWLAACALVAGCADDAPVAEGSVTVTVAGFQEVDLEMDAGDRITFEWRADNPLAFNIHSHDEAGGVTEHQTASGTSGGGGFTAPATGVYSLFWSTQAAPAGLHYEVRGEARVYDPVLH